MSRRSTPTRPGVVERLNLVGTNFQDQGGENYVLKYTGYLTDTFTLSALIGHGEFDAHSSTWSRPPA